MEVIAPLEDIVPVVLIDDGVIAPNPIVNAGVVVPLAQVAVTPLFAAAVETEVTVPTFHVLLAARVCVLPLMVIVGAPAAPPKPARV